MQTKLFRRDFTLVVIGQIISLFGNAILRFALPLYLLRETGSSRIENAIFPKYIGSIKIGASHITVIRLLAPVCQPLN